VTVGRYDAFKDPYSYRGSNCLKNKLGLRDQAVLQAFELEMSSLRAEEPLPNGRFGPAHYCQVHRHLFQDVYRWAGRYRTIRTAKDGNWSCFPEYIERGMDQLFRRMPSSTSRTAPIRSLPRWRSPGRDSGAQAVAASTARFLQ
jgi:cell filamentation protein